MFVTSIPAIFIITTTLWATSTAVPNSQPSLECFVCDNCPTVFQLENLRVCAELPAIIETTTRRSSTTMSPTRSSSKTKSTTTSTTSMIPSSSSTPDQQQPSSSFSSSSTSNSRTTTSSSPVQELPSSSFSSSSTAITTMTAMSSPSTVETVQSDKPATTDQGNINSTQIPTATSWLANTTEPSTDESSDSDEYEDYYDYNESDEQGNRSISEELKISNHSSRFLNSRQNIMPVCYTIRLLVNGNEMINRGCAFLKNGDRNLTCQALSKGQTLGGCSLCSSSQCNGLSTETVAASVSSGTNLIESTRFLSIILGLLMLFEGTFYLLM